jgi:hypothetical protein
MLYDVFSGNFSDITNAPARIKNAFINQGSIFDSEMAISAKPINRAMPDDSSMPASIKSGDNKMVILADALQKVGGGGNFARIGGQDYNRDIYGGLLSGKFKVKAEIIDGMAGFGATKGVQ